MMYTKKPIIEGASDKEITEGDTIDLRQGIKARDEVDGNLEYSFKYKTIIITSEY